MAVQPGFYSVNQVSASPLSPLRVAVGSSEAYSMICAGGVYCSEIVCPEGNFCVSGLRFPCPAGSYGATQQLATATCSGLCPAGRCVVAFELRAWGGSVQDGG